MVNNVLFTAKGGSAVVLGPPDCPPPRHPARRSYSAAAPRLAAAFPCGLRTVVYLVSIDKKAKNN